MDEISTLLEPLIPGLRRYACALVRDDEAADDLVQDTLERAISRWSLRRRDGSLKAWLFAIQRNLFLNGLRQKKRRGMEVGPEVLDNVPQPEAMEQAHGLRDVLDGLATLPEEQRSVLLLVSVEGMSYEEAALILDIPMGTVMSRLSRAREKMRSFMETGRSVVLRRVK